MSTFGDFVTFCKIDWCISTNIPNHVTLFYNASIVTPPG